MIETHPSMMAPALAPDDQATLDALHERFVALRGNFVGYPCNTIFNYDDLLPFLKFPINNVGDPFGDSLFRLNTFEIEKEMVDTVAELFRAPADTYWGYMTSGGTEGNMYGLYLARELHPKGMVYYSQHTHYSVAKIMRVLGTRSVMIRAQKNGEMDYDDLRETLRIHRDVPPIIVANIGSTMHGAVDNLDIIKGIFKDLAISESYIHCDAALSGMILPFVDDPQPFDFAAGIDSISVSGHKLIGSPIPYGMVVAKKKNVDRIARSVEYVGCLDTTISGSRNAWAPLVLWHAMKTHGVEGIRRCVTRSFELADYAIARFKEHGMEAWRHKNSVTVVFPRPSEEIFTRWQIAPCEDVAHIITLPHVTEAIIDALIADIVACHHRAPLQ